MKKLALPDSKSSYIISFTESFLRALNPFKRSYHRSLLRSTSNLSSPTGFYFLYKAIKSYNRSPPPIADTPASVRDRVLLTEPVQDTLFPPSLPVSGMCVWRVPRMMPVSFWRGEFLKGEVFPPTHTTAKQWGWASPRQAHTASHDSFRGWGLGG